MDRIFYAILAVLCLYLSSCESAPVMSYFNVSNKPIQPRAPQARKIIPLPYREPAPVWEEPDEGVEVEGGNARNFVKQYLPVYRPIKYGFVNPKTYKYDPYAAYRYNKRFIYTNLVY